MILERLRRPVSTVLGRPLSGFERLMLELGPSMGCDMIVLKIQGRVDTPRLKAAGKALAARHPMLRSRVIPGPPIRFEVGFAPEIEVTEHSGDWQTAVETELARSFDFRKSPLVRLGWCREMDGSRVWIAAHHAVVDGTALYLLARDLLRALAGELPSGSMPLPESSLKTPKIPPVGVRLAQKVWGSQVRSHIQDPVVPPQRPLLPGEPVASNAVFGHSAPGLAETRRKTAREKGATLGGLWCAATRLAMAGWARRSARDPLHPLEVAVQVNLRGRSQGPGKEDVAFFTGGLGVSVPLDPHTPFWDLARGYSEGMKKKLDSRFPQLIFAVTDGLDSMSALSGRRGVNLLKSAGTTKLLDASNVGPWPYSPSFGEYTLTEVYGMCGASIGGAAAIYWLRSLNGTLFWNAVGSSPYLERPELECQLSDISRFIHGVAESPDARVEQLLGI